ncbi:MFS transporter [uncultured Lactobacillus sp.]|uniref:MFS transporter n=1 Tax=uncultured Lactobacillus sp. TaxID=153152 RepID=UPI00280564B4|nr:MFS transporter [uncultured Lactobacillus sp.]
MLKINKKENANVRLLLMGRIATNIADSLFYMAVLWFFKVRFNSPLVLSLIFIADSTIDMISFVFGPIIDRTDIKKLLKYVTAGQAIFSLLTAILFKINIMQDLAIVILLVLYVISTIGSTLIYPAEEKILPEIVAKDKLLKTNGIFQMTYRTLDLFLDALATALITCFSLDFTMIISMLVFASALFFYARLYLPEKVLQPDEELVSGKYWQDLVTGWEILRREGRILILIVPFAITNLFYGIASIGLPYFASHYLTKTALGYGTLEFASSIGGLLGSMVVQKFSFGKNKLERFVTICLFLAGTSVILEPVVGRIDSIKVIGLILFFASAAFWISMMNINFEVLVQESFDSNVLGRINTINSSIISCMIPVGSFLGGIIVQHFGADCAIFLEGIAEILTAIYYFIVFK